MDVFRKDRLSTWTRLASATYRERKKERLLKMAKSFQEKMFLMLIHVRKIQPLLHLQVTDTLTSPFSSMWRKQKPTKVIDDDI